MKKRFVSLSASLLLLCFMLSGHALAWNPFDQACSSSVNAKTSVACDSANQGQTNPVSGSKGIILKVANIIALTGGVVAIFMIMISAFKYVTSSGDAKNISSAKDTILYAVIGLVVIALSRTIVIFIINKL